MENVKLNPSITDKIIENRNICLYAFYQIESLMDYYYQRKYSEKMQELYEFLIKYNNRYSNEEKRNQLKGKSLQEIDSADKITAFGYCYFPKDSREYQYSGVNMNLLRKIRNEESHPTSKSIERIEQVEKFLKHSPYKAIIKTLEDISSIIKREIS